MKSLYETQVHQDILSRIEALTENSQPLWGKMNVAQMLAHCLGPLNVTLGKQNLKKPNFIMKILFSFYKASLYNDKPWKHNLPTSREYRIVDKRNFLEEKNKLIELINAFYAKKDDPNWPSHPICGDFTHEQRGQMQYKHLDHHLRQFGV
ncbi:DUF1569 domain-containing protein [Snuella lapsa]|uniref:DUF1569 domain-containing protein n=1 Tax=Snuella lapsa TaxID=870481 RepID=A0ABP6XET2_9FLAO